MALFKRSSLKISSITTSFFVRNFSKTDSVKGKNIKKSVFVSQSKDIYTNLALQEWLYKKFDFTNHHVLMIWQNDPCVIIGVHQNPWLETNYADLNENGVHLARRCSNGEAMYQDNGNLNLTFFSPRGRYNSKYNTEIISRGLFREFGLKINTDDEELLIRNNKQFSCKAAKIGEQNAYNFYSLMVRMNKVDENIVLQKHNVAIKTGPTISTDTYIKKMNLCEENPQISSESVVKAVGWEFLRTKPLSLEDAGIEYANQQKGFHLVNPTESWFPGLNEIRDTYNSWDWCYGKTPSFNVSQTFNVPGEWNQNSGASTQIKVTMKVENGRIADIIIFIPYGSLSMGETKAVHNFRGKKFSIRTLNDLEESLGGLLLDDRFISVI